MYEINECPEAGIETTATIKGRSYRMPTFRINLKEDSWLEEHRGAIIFWSWATGIILFGLAPWVIGWIGILKWIF